MRLSLLPLGVPLLFFCFSCQAPNALRDDVAPDGEPVRVETAEESAEAVGDTEVAQRMAAYRARGEAPRPNEARNPSATSVAELPEQSEQEDEGEVPVSAAIVADRLTAHLAHPTSTRIVSAEDLGITDTTAAAFDPFEERGCPPEGTATSSPHQKLNRLKNRISKPHASDIDGEVTFDALRAPSTDDHTRWSTGTAATIEGYCRLAKAAGGETCNCGKTQTALTDTHFEIVSGSNDHGQPVIAEVTPVWKLIHKHFNQEDWSSSELHSKYQGHKVRITGWLFFDEMHVLEADNTDQGDQKGKANWRATCWEIHPITSIEIVQ
jgi:hypothetical protein